jgi:cytochrome oxidase Cu insertion factor (SCO1/SenC/PrrC family)
MKRQNNFSRLLFAPLMMASLLLPTSSVSQVFAGVGAQTRRATRQTKSGHLKYVCPMHPEVESKSPGKCPKCKMALVRKRNSDDQVAQSSGGDIEPASGTTEDTGALRPMRIPDTPVYDQDGEKRNFYTDLVKGKTVAINFIFTDCVGVCPTLSAKFRKLQQELGDRIGRDIQLISISVDPTTDVPERLKAYGAKFKAGPGWTLVTGSRPEIDQLLRSLGSYTADKNSHTQMFLIGNEATGYWTRISGLASTSELISVINEAAAKSPAPASKRITSETNGGRVMVPLPDSLEFGAERQVVRSAGAGSAASTAGAASTVKAGATKSLAEASASYFPNHVLLTQENKPVRFYDDLLKGKVVMINFMFTTCNGVCPPMMANLAKVQRYLGERVGREVVMISISVDPLTDTTAALKRYANNFKAGPGWYFLTGKKEDVDAVLRKLGGYAESKFEHSSLVIIGNEATGDWTKAPALMNPSELASVVVQLIESK